MSPDDIRKLIDVLGPGDEAEVPFGGTHIKIRKAGSVPQWAPTLPSLPHTPYVPQAPVPQIAPGIDPTGTGYPFWGEKSGTIVCTTDNASPPRSVTTVVGFDVSGVRTN